MFKGSIVALATPFGRDGAVDNEALKQLIDWHCDSGSDGLVIAGTTGESATLASDEHIALVARSVEIAAGRLPIIAGTGSNSTAQTQKLSQACERAGAQGFLLVAPYYNRPPQEGLYRHFCAVADVVNKPVILYNVPGRTCSDIQPETVGRLAEHANIIGIKDATGDVERLRQTQTEVSEDFLQLSGDDFTAMEFLLAGGHGVISVTANVVPRLMATLCRECAAGDRLAAEKTDEQMQALNSAMFLESNPIPVKWALHKMGKMTASIRLPLVPIANPARETLERALEGAGLVD